MKHNKLFHDQTSAPKLVEAPVFQIAIRQRGANSSAGAPGSKPQKRDNVFSKSRDTREDRGSRQMKTEHNSQTFPHDSNY
jgi:hypothetical protein